MQKNDRTIVFLGIIIVLIALVGAAVGGQPKIPDYDGDDTEEYKNWPIRKSPIAHKKGTSNENSDEMINFTVTESYVTRVVIILRWLDEADIINQRGRHENQPDTFNFTVFSPYGATISSLVVFNPREEAGIIEEIVILPEEGVKNSDALGIWDINIHCGNCGDQVPPLSVTNLRTEEDTKNDWAMTFEYEFHGNE